jgi:hypothetical protein
MVEMGREMPKREPKRNESLSSSKNLLKEKETYPGKNRLQKQKRRKRRRKKLLEVLRLNLLNLLP